MKQYFNISVPHSDTFPNPYREKDFATFRAVKNFIIKNVVDDYDSGIVYKGAYPYADFDVKNGETVFYKDFSFYNTNGILRKSR